MKRFFSYDPNDRIRFHDTAEEAKAEAESALDAYRDEAPEGWDENTDEVCWGEVKEQVQETMRRPYDPERDHDIDGDCTEVIDYALLPLPETIPQA